MVTRMNLHTASASRRTALLALLTLLTASVGAEAQPEGLHGLVPNRGQVVDVAGHRRPDILYTVESGAAHVFVRPGSIAYVFDRYARREDLRAAGVRDDGGAAGTQAGALEDESPWVLIEQYRMDLELLGARAPVSIVEEDPSPGLRNYYLAHCPDGITGIPAFRRVTLREVYPHIDMVLRTVDGGMKVDFVVLPGGRPSDIRMRYIDAGAVRLRDDGGLKATTPLGELVELAPVSLQSSAGGERTIATRFVLEGDVVTFDVGAYDPSLPLVIDPVRQWSTYFGGPGKEQIAGGQPSEVDRAGNVIAGGSVTGTAFPVTTGAFQPRSGGVDDGCVVKFDTSGAVRWATYYGGSSLELVHGIVAADDLDVFVSAHTFSEDLPVTPDAWQSRYAGNRDAFVVRLDSSGVRRWASYYGGSEFDDPYAITLDGNGNPIVIVTTTSNGLQSPGMIPQPVRGKEWFDCLVVKLDRSGALRWATYFGGSESDFGFSIAVDRHESIIVSGWTYSNNLPVVNAAQDTLGSACDAFVAKFDRDGAPMWATYFGGPAMENDLYGALGLAAVAIDSAGNVFLGGVVTGAGLPVTPGVPQPAFGGGALDGYLAAFDSFGALRWATYLGGSGDDAVSCIATGPAGTLGVAGLSGSTDLRVTGDCEQCRHAGRVDALVALLSNDGTVEWIDYFGGEALDGGHGIAFDRGGAFAVTGITHSTALPVAGAAQPVKGGSSAANGDLFVARFVPPPPPVGYATVALPHLTAGDIERLSIALTLERSSDLDLVVADSFTVVLRGDQALFFPVDSTLGEIVGTDRVITLSGSRPAGLDRGTLLELPVISGFEPFDSAALRIDTLWWHGANVVTTREHGSLTIVPRPGPHPGGVGAMGPTMLISYDTPVDGSIDLGLFDALGRRVRLLEQRELPAGHYTVALDTAPLPRGTYFIVLVTPAGRTVRPLQVAH
jgi:hypothetical protein